MIAVKNDVNEPERIISVNATLAGKLDCHNAAPKAARRKPSVAVRTTCLLARNAPSIMTKMPPTAVKRPGKNARRSVVMGSTIDEFGRCAVDH